ncbi:unnamed protein product, partial [Symbiodinium sp. KB8]
MLLSFQQLREAAGVAAWLPVEAWIEPFREPVPQHRILRLYAGSLVVFRNTGEGCPELHHLTDMLRRVTGWDQLADLPFSFDPAVWILSDDGPFRFLIEPEQGGLRRQDVAQALRDLSHVGLCTSAALVVSHTIPNLRGPRFGPCVVFLDQRPMLADLSWMVCPDGLFHLSAFVATLPRRCPPGFQVTVWGAFPVAGTDQYRVADGTKLTFTFELVQPSTQRNGIAEDRSDSDSPDSRHTMMSDSDSDASSNTEDSPNGPPAGPPPPVPAHHTAGARCCFHICIALHGLLAVQPAAATQVCYNQASTAQVSSFVVLAGFCLRALLASYAAIWLRHWGITLCGHVCRLLCDLTFGGSGLSVSYQTLWDVTRQLALPWPLEPLHAFAPAIQGTEADDTLFQPTMMRIRCVILKPEYIPETTAIELTFPCALGEVVDELQASRSTYDFLTFPHLLHVNPQPIRGLAVFLALPRWHPTATVICLNTATIDGRIFATYAPDRLNVDELCWLADLPTQAQYVVYVGGDDQPLPADVQVHVASGDHVIFMEHEGVPLPDRFCAPTNGNIPAVFLSQGCVKPTVWPSASISEQLPEVRPGMTLIADYVPCVGADGRPTFATAPHALLSAPDGVEGDGTPPETSADSGFRAISNSPSTEGAASSGGQPSPLPADGPALQPSRSPNLEEGGGDEGGDPDDSPTMHLHETTVGESSSQPLPFLIFSVEYQPEGILPGLVPPLTLSAALAAIEQRRAPTDHRTTPRILPVHPQPPRMPAVLVALPSWPTESVTVFFDCHVLPRRVFAETVPRFFCRGDVLTMAKVAASTPCHIFHRDVPWPIPEGYWIYPSEGDWIGIYPEGEQPGPLATLRQHLQGEDGPRVAAPIPEDSFEINSAQAADILGLRPGRFVLVPAVPELTDHSHCGVPSRRVLLAKQTDDSDEEDSREAELVPYILDLRPVQLYLCQAAAPDGIVDVAEVCRRLLIRCPRGFHVRLYGGAYDADAGNHSRRVRAGEILSVEYHPDYVREVVSQIDPGTYSLGTPSVDNQGSVHEMPTGSASSTHSGSADAGTGGSATFNSGPVRHIHAQHRPDACSGLANSQVRGPARMWFPTFSSLHAIPDGKVSPTSVCKTSMPCGPISVWSCRLRDSPVGTRAVASHQSRADMVPRAWAAAVAGTGPVPSSALPVVALRVTLVAFLCHHAIASDALFPVLLCILARHRRVGFLSSVLILISLGKPSVVLGVQLPRPVWPDKGNTPAELDTSGNHLSARIDPIVNSGFWHLGSSLSRPLPTPCRSVRPHTLSTCANPRGTTNDLRNWHLCTLLEESCRDQEGYPFYLAATLVDALRTHFAPPSVPRQILCLQDLVLRYEGSCAPEGARMRGPRGCIPVRLLPLPFGPGAKEHNAEVTIGRTPLGFSLRSLANFIRAPANVMDYEAFRRACPAISSIPNLHWPDVFQDFRHLVPDHGLVVYTDGSFTPGSPLSAKAGWATIFLDPHHETFSAAFGPVIGFPTDTTALSPYVAECYALMAAALIATAAYHDRPLVFLSDCVAAVGVAAGKMTFQLALRKLQRRHTTCAGNCVPEAMCTTMSRVIADLLATRWLTVLPGQVLTSRGALKLPWAATVLRSLQGDPGLPPINGEDLGRNCDHAHLSASELIQPFVPEGALSDTCDRPIQESAEPVDSSYRASEGVQLFALRAVTFNVLSLGKPKDARPDSEVTQGLAYQPARAALLADQLLGQNIHVAFLQAGHSTPDHVAACAAVQFQSLCGPAEAKLTKRKIRAADICAPENQTAISEVFRSVPCVPWGVSVHAHAAIITKHVQDGLQRVAGPQATRPHHAYLSDATWQLQRAVSKLRRQFHQLSHRILCCGLAAGFCAWARGLPLRAIFFQSCRWQAQAERARQAMHLALTEQCKLLRKACRRDRDVYIGQLAETIAKAPSKDAFAAYHAILAHRRKKLCSPDPLPQVLDSQGEVCPDAPSMRSRWREHFAALEGGQDTTFHQIAVHAASEVTDMQPTHPPAISDVPSLPDLCRVLAATKVGKASGMDSIPAEINRAFTQEVAEVLFPILLKMLWRGAEPVGYKGGQAIIMYKGRGQTSACTSYRSILLMNTWAKTLHQSVRPLIRDVFEQTAPALQLGGRSGCSVTFGSHILRGIFRCAHRDNVPAFVLFADISAAFYSPLVQLVAHSPSTTSTEGLQTALQGLALPGDVTDELRALLQEPSALSQSSASSWLEQLAAHIGERNWFVIAGDSVPIATGRGTRPGSSWADVLFALLMPKVLRKRDALLEAMGAAPVRPTFPWDGTQSLAPCADDCPLCPVEEVVWADDIAIPRLCPLVSAMARAVRAETTALTEAFLSFGFRLAFGEHKTAAVVSVCGPGSRAVKRSLYSHDGLQGQLPILFEHLEAMKLPLTTKYKHLGVLQTPTGSILEEIRHRAALARSTYHEARRKVYKSKAISMKRKSTLLATTVLPKLLQGAGAWPPLNKREHQAYAGAVWGFYRGVLGVHRNMDQRITASTCFSLLQLPDPDTLLRLTRLSYLAQIIRSGPDILWAIVRADRPYADMLTADLLWLYAWVWNTCSLPSPEGHWEEWHLFIKTSPNRFKGLCKRARALSICQDTVTAALDNLHCALADLSGS